MRDARRWHLVGEFVFRAVDRFDRLAQQIRAGGHLTIGRDSRSPKVARDVQPTEDCHAGSTELNEMTAVRLAGLVVAIAIATPALGTPIFLDSERTRYVDFAMSLSSSVELVPGETGFIHASLTNNGNASVAFAEYDAANPFGGFGWNFTDPGLFIGFGGASYTPGVPSGSFGRAEGINANPLTLFSAPDLSHLSNVLIAPGETFEFILYSMRLAPDVAIGTSFSIGTYIELAVGTSVFEAVDSVRFSMLVAAAGVSSNGSLQQISFGPSFSYAPRHEPVPEPGTVGLFGFGIAILAVIRRRTRGSMIKTPDRLNTR